ncbi:membrane steroid-binding protein 2-like [Pyrus ussuriensis x Pyrus communis]|uniref:Membrane steroid-binding protein 2-like n=1 Tax=Pyrus ussuriensis x Pyrus communis TaxID=2448454 RepID=A0A5N5HZT0_9ROSA|nr:membrane steroid-binding protein 2-like [Pyrus ussuriensis x Pyrus communis]
MEGIYRAVMEEIWRYTGLSPAAFFTIAGMMIVVYRIVTGMFVDPEDFNKPPVAAIINTVDSYSKSNFVNKYLNSTGAAKGSSVQMGDMTEEQLREYGGSNPNKPLLVAIRARIYDVSSSRNFYGPGGPYAMFAGREVSRALALLSFKPQDINGNLEGLGPDELGILQDWEEKFIEKYDKVGQLVAEPRANSDEQN